jgi:lysophospholipid acyltransferase (LPLAT)-like uncharacterized protein
VSGEAREIEQERPLTTKQKLLIGVISGVIRIIGSTLRLKVIGQERFDALKTEHNGAILVTWHGRTLIPIYLYRQKGYWALISLSLDGNLQAANFRRFGFQVIRGSTGRRGVMATRQILTALNDGGVLAFTPDGPRGPSQKAQEGVVYFAKKSGKPILPVGVAANPAFQAKSWDKYMVPHPFARAAYVYGEPIFVGGEEENSEACVRVEAGINEAQARAEEALHL